METMVMVSMVMQHLFEMGMMKMVVVMVKAESTETVLYCSD